MEMSEFESRNTGLETKEKKKGKGCLFWGFIIFFTLIISVIGISYYAVTSFIGGLVETYADTSPASLPHIELSDSDTSDLQNKVSTFKQSIEVEGGDSSTLRLSADELNFLIMNSPDAGKLKDHFYLEIVDNKVSGQVSIPLDEVGYPGKFVNGAISLSIKLENGILDVRVADLKIKGHSVQDEVLQALANENLASEAYDNPDFVTVVQRLESIRVENGEVVIISK